MIKPCNKPLYNTISNGHLHVGRQMNFFMADSLMQLEQDHFFGKNKNDEHQAKQYQAGNCADIRNNPDKH